MQYISHYQSPVGGMLLAADEAGLTGLWFDGAAYYARNLEHEHKEMELPVFSEVKRWLDLYFSGNEPDFMPSLHIMGTDFQKEVWEILRTIPYGETTTYGAIAAKLARQHGLAQTSARAVGGAVGHNAISLLIPCHRVVGSDGSLTGYAGGIEKKIALLKLEGAYKDECFVPLTAP